MKYLEYSIPVFVYITDPDLEPVGVQVEAKAIVEAEDDVAEEEDDDKPYFED